MHYSFDVLVILCCLSCIPRFYGFDDFDAGVHNCECFFVSNRDFIHKFVLFAIIFNGLWSVAR